MNMIKLQRTSKKISIETQNALKKKISESTICDSLLIH